MYTFDQDVQFLNCKSGIEEDISIIPQIFCGMASDLVWDLDLSPTADTSDCNLDSILTYTAGFYKTGEYEP